MTHVLRHLTLTLAILILPTRLGAETESTLDATAVQQAFLKFLDEHPRSFEGYTAGLRKSAEKLVLSEDGEQAHIGSIGVDLTTGAYQFERWTEGGAMPAAHLIWSGTVTKRADGTLSITTPSVMEEWIRQ
ncbi:hypothetical protein [Tahibacter amnicola]|uniref:Uncharacterized protein n=1 Tax=Tahibacter amnicola TaxID=2976241 RepID=A0ABY6BKP6_9GAMM|nr:hypothetical protein [Tahibacter amnicola]UXI70593.1 hypothetical protein N4264_13405 [Tahibacter amnicola]